MATKGALTFTQLAVAGGTAPKYVKNAEQILGISWDRNESGAWRLALVSEMNAYLGVPLAKALEIAATAERSDDQREMVVPASREASIGIAIDSRRARSNFLARLSRALVLEVPRQRGRPQKRAPDPIEAAVAEGVDVDILRSSRALSVAERLDRLDSNAAFIHEMQRSRDHRTDR